VRRELLNPALLIALFAWCLAVPTAARVVQFSPDMVEYVDVARRLLNGEGYVLGVKAYHIGGYDVIHDGLVHRPPLFPLMLAGLLGLGLNFYGVQLVNVAFGAFSAAMVCSIGTRLFGRTVGIAAGILAAASPVGFEQQAQILSDALGTALTLGAVRLVILAADRTTARATVVLALLAGLVFGLGYLDRPPIIIIAVALLAALPFAAPSREQAWRLMLGLAAGLAIICVPVTLYSLLTRGRLSYSGKGYLFGVVSDADIMENGFATQPLSPIEFVTNSPSYVLGAIWSVTSLYLRSIFLERDWLLPLALGWPGALLTLVQGRLPWVARLVLVAAAANLAFYMVSWSIWQDRYLLPTVFLLLPFVVDGLLRLLRGIVALVTGRSNALVGSRGSARVGGGRLSARVAGALPVMLLGLVVMGTLVVWSPRFIDQYRGQFRYGERPSSVRTTEGLRWTGPPRWVNDGNLDDVIDWAAERTTPDMVMAHGQPWPFAFFTGRPMVLLPYRLNDANLRRFLIVYRVSYVLHDPRDPQRRDYGDQLRDLETDGVRGQRLKNLVVYDTRALWE
jgi:4-amino-4-deoxy-L-arabinose transferase-like glycosyltransferase